MVKNPPANAEDTGSSPGPGRSHMPRSNAARAPQLLSLRSRAREPQLLKPAHLEPVLRNKRSHGNEKPAHSNKDPMQPNIKKNKAKQKINKFIKKKFYFYDLSKKNRRATVLQKWFPDTGLRV